MTDYPGNPVENKIGGEQYNFLFNKAAIPAALTKLPENVFVEINDAFQKIFGYSKNEVIGKTSLELGMVQPEEREQTIRDIKKYGFSVDLEKHVFTKAGELRYVIINVNAFESDGEKFTITTLQDITERIRAEHKIIQLKRLYATLSQINQTIVRVKERSELYQSICNVSAKFGEFGLAWICLLDEETGIVNPVACNGENLTRIPFQGINISDPQYKNDITCLAILKKRTFTCNDIQKDPGMKHWQNQNAWLEYRSQAAVPFRLQGKTIGVLNLHSTETGFFSANEEIRLLDEIGKDISFALDALEIEKHQTRNLNDLRQLQEKLQAREGTLKLFVEYAPAAIAMFDKSMKYIAVSERFIADYHLKNRDIIGHSHYEIFPEISENWKSIHRNCLAGNSDKADKDPFFRMDGNLDWIQWEIHPWYEKSGEIGGIILFSEVITERIQAEEELIKSENRFRTTLETMLEGCQIMDFDWRYIFLNHTAEIHNRMPRNKMLGRTYTEVWPGIEKTRVYAVIKRALKERTATQMEYEFTYPDGSVGWFELSILPVPEGVFILSIDITKRKRAEEKLTEALEQSSNIIRTSPQAIIVTDKKGIISVWNEAAEEIFGWKEDELTGKLIPIIPEDKSDELRIIRERLMKGESIINFETVRRHKNGSLVQVSYSASPLRNGKYEISGILTVVQDISQRKQAEEEIKKLNEELELRVIERTKQFEAANKELEAFSYSVSHDLRAPLRAMSGFARILQESYSASLDDEGNRVLQIITGNAKKMGNLIDDLLAFSRLGKKEIHFSTVNMHDLAESVYHDLASEKEKETINFILHTIPPAFGDESMIKQVWANLIGNALKFSSLKEDRIIEIDGYENGTENIYSIKDNGAGFDMKYVNKLFGVFQRLHSANQFEGTGVGLAIVQRIIVRLNGRVWAEGIEGKGAGFYFTLSNQLNA